MLCCYTHATFAIKPAECKLLGLLFACFCIMSLLKTGIGGHTSQSCRGCNGTKPAAGHGCLQEAGKDAYQARNDRHYCSSPQPGGKYGASCECVHVCVSSLHGMAYALYCRKRSLNSDRLHLNHSSCPCIMYGTENRC